MSFLSYWDIFGLVLITLYFILSWLYPKRTQQKAQAKAEKEEYSRTCEREDLRADKDADGLSSEPFIDRKSDIPKFVWSTSRSSLNGDGHAESTPQEVNTSSCKIDSSSVENIEEIQPSHLVSDLSLPSFESTIASKESLVDSLQDDGHPSKSPNDELPSDTSPKFSELSISPEDISLSLAEIPETENKERVSNEEDLGDNKKDASKPVQHEEVLSNSYMECNKNVRDGVEGLPPFDVSRAASVVSDFNDNLNTSSGETASSREIQTAGITSCNAEKISREIIEEAMDSIDRKSSEQKGVHLEKFANDLASTTIETAVDNSISLNTFAESLSEKICSDSADDVISEVQASLKKQKIEAKMQKELEMEELESLGMCVASNVVNEAVGEAALKKEYMDSDELDVTSEIQPHIGFVVENVVNTAIFEAALKLKREDADEPSAPMRDIETSGPDDKSNEIETNNNVEASIIWPVEEPSKDEVNEVVAEGSQLGSELPSDVDKPLIEDLPVKENELVADEGGQLESELPSDVDKPLIEDLPVKENELVADEGGQLESELPSVVDKPFIEDLPVKENELVADEGGQLESELPSVVDKPSIEDPSAEASSKYVSQPADKHVENQSEQFILTDEVQKVDQQVEHVGHEFEENVSQLSVKSLTESAETENSQVTGEDDKNKEDEELTLENIPTSDEVIDAEARDETTISDAIEAKEKPKYDQVTGEDNECKGDEELPGENIPTSHEVINAEIKDKTNISEAKDKPKNEKVAAEDAITDEKTPVEDISTLHELINAKRKDVTPISDDIEAKDKPKNDQVAEEDAITNEKTPVEDISTSHELIDSKRKDETAISDSLEIKDKPALEQNISSTSDLDNNFQKSKDKHDESIDKEENTGLVIPEIKLTLDKEKSNETEGQTSPPTSPDIVLQHQVTLRNKDQQNVDNKDGFWRRSLILDLEEDLEFEDDSFDITSPDLSKEKQEVAPSEDSEDFTDSEEDEIIDHDAEAKLGAVGGSSKQVADEPEDEEFDWYDYEQDFDDEDDHGVKDFEPVFTVDGLCVSRRQEKEKPKLRSVGSHYNRAVVLDNGSGIIKAGYAGDRVPRVIQQNVTGMPQRFSMHITGMESNLKDYKKYGSEAVSKAGVMHLTHPMKAGLIDNWTDIEEIWEYLLYEELGAEIGDNPVLVTEISGNPRKNREKIAEILFEHLNVPAMYLADQLPLSMYASGMTSGVCLSSGFSCTQAGVIYEGHTLAYTQQQLDIGGGDLTENLKILLRDVRARNFTTSSGWQIVNDIKETMAFVAKDYDHDIDKYQKNDSLTQYYKLPDGQMVDVGYECMSCVEPLFQPDTLMSANSTTASQQPVHKLIDTAIKRCNPDLQDLCYKHIVLSGGTTLLKGFTSRLQHELHRINHRIRKIRTPEHRRYSAWIGGSILASLSSFDEQYVTVDDYSECGAPIINRKCF